MNQQHVLPRRAHPALARSLLALSLALYSAGAAGFQTSPEEAAAPAAVEPAADTTNTATEELKGLSTALLEERSDSLKKKQLEIDDGLAWIERKLALANHAQNDLKRFDGGKGFDESKYRASFDRLVAALQKALSQANSRDGSRMTIQLSYEELRGIVDSPQIALSDSNLVQEDPSQVRPARISVQTQSTLNWASEKLLPAVAAWLRDPTGTPPAPDTIPWEAALRDGKLLFDESLKEAKTHLQRFKERLEEDQKRLLAERRAVQPERNAVLKALSQARGGQAGSFEAINWMMYLLGGMFVVSIGARLALEMRGNTRAARIINDRTLIEFGGMSFLLLTIIILSTIDKLEAQGLAALLGTIAGYIFGKSTSARDQDRPLPANTAPNAQEEAREGASAQ